MTSIDPDYARRLEMRHMTNSELFDLYDSDLVLRLHNAKNVSDQEYQQSDKPFWGNRCLFKHK